MRIVLAVVGGGSVNWMRKLMRDVYLMDEIEGGEIRLIDPRVEHANAVAEMCRAFNRMRGKDYEISVINDRQEAFKDADFVMTTFSPGTMDAFYNDLEIPIKYGIRQPVSMTVGPCGISAAIRTAPVAYEIVEDMEISCPGAWLLNVTNPMSVVTRAMNMAARTVRVIGMCHEFHASSQYVGPIIGLEQPDGMDTLDYLYRWLPEQGLDYTVAGLNHFIFLTKATLKGEDLIPKIHQYAIDHWDMVPLGEDKTLADWSNRTQGVKMAVCRHFGYMDLAGDRHLIEFWPSLCNLRNGFGMKYDVIKTTVGARRLGKGKSLDYIRRTATGEEEVDWTPSAEEMTEIMGAILTKTSTSTIVNMPNEGQITNLPKDVVVETLATVSADGIVPKPSGDLPGPIGSLCRLHADVHELTVRAALEGDCYLLVQALSLDPLSAGADFAEIGDLADELLLANKQWLPRFFE